MRFGWLALLAAPLLAQSGQEFFELKDLKLESGQMLAACRVGYRTFGTLNADRSNAVLFPTWFSGKSEDLVGFMGVGQLVDTTKYFAVAVDALGNGVSCGAGGGRITIGDMVRSQHRLMTEKFGIRKLHAVMGISMGGMQTFEWITAFPEFMKKAVPIIGSPKLTSVDLQLWQAELSAIEAVRAAGGDPRTAMPAVLAMHRFALTTPAEHLEKTPAEDFAALRARLEQDAKTGMDPLDWAAQLRAMMAQDVARNYGGSLEKAGAAVQAQVLVVVATQDHMVNPGPALQMAAKSGFSVLRLGGNCGHMATSCESGKLISAVSAFLKQ
jgi:homoserine O-acetyltransferase/O-succinyltransferase